MDRQNIFNRVARHLLEQKVASKSEDGYHCLYRGPDNTKCAIGCLIPNDMFRAEMNELCVNTLIMRYPEFNDKFEINSPYDLKFLSNLQKVHDTSPPKFWKIHLNEVASSWGLDPAVINLPID